MKQLKVNISDELLERFKIKCIKKGVYIKDAVVKLIEDYMDKSERYDK